MDTPLFTIDSTSGSPKYRQIIDGIIQAIERKELSRGDVLPSVNQLYKDFALARETVIKAYAELKSQGIVESIPGKGYYVASEYVKHGLKIFLLFDALSAYKQDLYNAFKKEIGPEAILDVYFHHFNIEMFEMLLLDSIGKYGYYLVMPFAHPKISDILAKLDQTRLLNGDKSYFLVWDREHCVAAPYSYIGQEFEMTVYACLQEALRLIKKYARFVLMMPESIHHPSETKAAFVRFCEQYGISYALIEDWEQEPVTPGTAYFVVDDSDLLHVVETCKEQRYVLGKTVGLLSYNETALKRVIGDGITVISTDFRQLGKRTAQYIREPILTEEIIPTRLIVRSSL